ncbi:cell cycle transcriptional regulator TrcR [Alphaproteobacteria bacterium endosymbiont of Tiliacea citrago]|uniref:cell cycle transcriptional regulator TrcR n=1 Tax=Alphaproteobacteria bacterium endosymbiont of Tiliacea citrago TaxID=3077944 RepID=UPI00313BAEE7
MSEKVLMSNGVALWLARNTKLSLEQIAEFCNMHPLQIYHLRENTESINGIIECNPIDVSMLTQSEIDRCEKNATASLTSVLSGQKHRQSSKKSGCLDGILWMIRHYPELDITSIAKILKCSTTIVKSVKNETCRNMNELLPKNPVSLGLCTQTELDEFLVKYI